MGGTVITPTTIFRGWWHTKHYFMDGAVMTPTTEKTLKMFRGWLYTKHYFMGGAVMTPTTEKNK